ncbi:MAG: thioredoxin family protein [Candidatus Methanoperedenaceae archaeon]|nr:thioredoxin family protein [Candidatus Methanoperedenaceae archaeon]
MKTKKLISIFVLILIISIAYETYYISLSQFKLSDTNSSYLGGLTWSRSLDDSLLKAQQENKPVVVYFWAIWCQYCARFQSDTLGNPQVKEILETDYVLVAMDLDIDRDVARKYGVSYPPYVLFLDGNDNVLERVPGAVDANYFLPIVTKVRDQVRSK